MHGTVKGVQYRGRERREAIMSTEIMGRGKDAVGRWDRETAVRSVGRGGRSMTEETGNMMKG